MSKLSTMNPGEVRILSVGAGDTKLTFDPSKPADRDRAAKVVTDMLKRGYAILVQVGERDGKPLFQRAESFDEKTCEYIIVGAPPEGIPYNVDEQKAPKSKKNVGRHAKFRVPAGGTRTVAVARTAGG
ncbi:MAG: hypothetical protein K9G48_05390 [Reyranella sp.]|nr:hypothetical protein [Reyranella sp.]